MEQLKRRIGVIGTIGAILLCAGCGDLDSHPDGSQFTGYWSGDWGNMVIRQLDDGTFRGTYDHDTGTFTATRVTGGTLSGWWCEEPSRQPTEDAGRAEFDVDTTASPDAIDGRWSNGRDGEWKEDWDLERQTDDPPAELVERFNNESMFCDRP